MHFVIRSDSDVNTTHLSLRHHTITHCRIPRPEVVQAVWTCKYRSRTTRSKGWNHHILMMITHQYLKHFAAKSIQFHGSDSVVHRESREGSSYCRHLWDRSRRCSYISYICCANLFSSWRLSSWLDPQVVLPLYNNSYWMKGGGNDSTEKTERSSKRRRLYNRGGRHWLVCGLTFWSLEFGIMAVVTSVVRNQTCERVDLGRILTENPRPCRGIHLSITR